MYGQMTHPSSGWRPGLISKVDASIFAGARLTFLTRPQQFQQMPRSSTLVTVVPLKASALCSRKWRQAEIRPPPRFFLSVDRKIVELMTRFRRSSGAATPFGKFLSLRRTATGA